MNKLVTHKDIGAPDLPRRPDIATVMNNALAPYHIIDEWKGLECLMWDVRNMLARESATGELRVLKTKDQAKRFQLHCRTHEILDELPTNDLLLAKFQAVTTAIMTEPKPQERKYLLGAMLDVLGIPASDSIGNYINGLSWMLADVQPDDNERRSYKPPRWIPLPAIADAVNRIWETCRDNHYGRPPLPAYVLEECIRSRCNLAHVRYRIAEIGRARQGLQKIIAATDDSYPPDDE
jgi:hypothetical protein